MLQHVRASPPPPPRSCSPAPRAFDPQFPRVLVSAIPLQPIQLPEQSKVWDTLAGLLDISGATQRTDRDTRSLYVGLSWARFVSGSLRPNQSLGLRPVRVPVSYI
ncbi:hypothetical protein EDD16DRAFT_587066 [Pisolithus croceorrhizus]|nr:hypothetical protein EDD16DRAFT_587066 [Pisolithus croceorrhizus]